MRVKGVIGTQVLTVLLTGLILGLVIVGCDHRESVRNNNQMAVDNQIPSDAEIIEDLTSSKKTITNQDEDLLELKHWQYGATPSQPAEGTTISYQLVDDEQMNHIINCLIEGGYLSEQPGDEYTFRRALQEFQQDRGLLAKGELDAATLEALLNSDL